MKRYSLNLNKIRFKATHGLFQLDETFIGTSDYMGLGYFWAQEYKCILREASITMRVKIHKSFLKAGLKLDDTSDKHVAIINSFIKK